MKLINLLRVGWKGIKTVAKVQAIKTLEDAVEAGLPAKSVPEFVGGLTADGTSLKDFINKFKHNLVHEYLYPFAANFEWTAEELDAVIPALKVFYKKLYRAYKSQKKFRGGN